VVIFISISLRFAITPQALLAQFDMDPRRPQ
jgi:hypothetical protein